MPESRIELIQGDITHQDVSVIVNAANSGLLGGGGVDGAIHRAAGPGLLQECRKLGGCATGEAKVTGAYDLKAQWIIHTVGPVYKDGKSGEDRLLASCYRRSLELAKELGAVSIAFPSISTGAYRFPVERACRIALGEIKQFLAQNPVPEKVVLVCFDSFTYGHYARLFSMI
ncbi:MAG: O-acetyl-ADP-ribose deacetylase [Acidobacteria bacterium]|nr:O-acetyl-ADP-ribose deacetylase [Acidobacteriota bacterium]